MQFQDSIKTCISKYATFEGRASRSEFWWWTLFVVLITVAGNIINEKAAALATIATLLPYFAVTSRRLHDIDRSGWWQLIGFLPVVGWLVLIYWCIQPAKGPNNYGEPTH